MVRQVNCMMDYLKRYIYNRRKKSLIYGLILIMTIIFFGFLVQFDLIRIVKGIPSMMNLFERMLKPNFGYIGEVGEKLLETVEIAGISSIVGIIAAMPLSILISKNIAPSKILWRVLNLVFGIFRTIPALVWAAILVSIFSIGKFSGILALSITSFLVSLKMFKDYIEGINQNVLDSTRSVGGSNFQVLKYCVFPTIVEQSVAIFFTVLEINIRGATVLGFVGAGGIGQIMWRDLNHLRYDNLSTLILFLLLIIFTIDFISLNIRKRFRSFSIDFKSMDSFKNYKKAKNIFFLLVILLVGVVSYRAIGINMERMIVGLKQGFNIVSRMVRVDLSYMDKLLKGLLESISIAIFATIIGSISSLILTYFSAYNLRSNKYTVGFFKFIINLLRTFPSIVIAIILFRGVGPGPLSGAIALSFYTTGVLTKVYSEVVEGLPDNLLNSIRVTGANNLAIYKEGVIPATMPNFISLALYRLESNIRNSTILGIIGAGGVGTSLTMNINWRNWERVGLLILGIAITVFAIDLISNKIRDKYI